MFTPEDKPYYISATQAGKLIEALENLDKEFYPCDQCEGTGNDPYSIKSACRTCGGYGFNPGGDIRNAIIEARAILAKVKG